MNDTAYRACRVHSGSGPCTKTVQGRLISAIFCSRRLPSGSWREQHHDWISCYTG